MTAGSDGTGKENTSVIQNKLELLGQSGHISRQSGCGLLFPNKCVSHTLSIRIIFLVPAHAFFFSFLSVTYSLSFIHSFSLPHFFCSCPLIHSLSLSASTSCFDLSSCHPFLYLYQISIPFSSGPRLPSPALVLSLC